ncbi:MAG: hypothetical protein U0Q11_17040 [Vicinamibacterales bacterium]
MSVIRALARLLLLVSISGIMPQPFSLVNGADGGSLRAVHGPPTVTLTRAARSVDAAVGMRDDVRLDKTGRTPQIHIGIASQRLGLTPLALNGTAIAHDLTARSTAPRSAASLRGPPSSI